MIDTTVLNTVGGTVSVTYFVDIAQSMGDNFSAALYDQSSKKLAFLFPTSKQFSVSEDIDETKAKAIINTFFGVRAEIIKNKSNSKIEPIRCITDVSFDKKEISGFIINGFQRDQNKWEMIYFKNDIEVRLPIEATRFTINTIRNEMKIEPDKLDFENVEFVDSLIPVYKPLDPSKTYFNKSNNTLTTFNGGDPDSYSELTVENGLVEVEKAPVDVAPNEGIYNVSGTYYELIGGKLTNISGKVHTVTEFLPLTGTVAVPGKCYIVNDSVYAVNANKVSNYQLKTVTDGVYPAKLTKGNFYRFTTTEVADHPEITLNSLYVCKTVASGLELVNPDTVIVSDTIPVMEVAIEGEYYIKGTEVKQVVSGAYEAKGTVITAAEAPDISTPVIVENTFYYVTSTKELIYKLKGSSTTTLKEGTNFEFIDQLPPYYDLTLETPNPSTLYVLKFKDGDKEANTAWLYDAVDTYDYKQVLY